MDLIKLGKNSVQFLPRKQIQEGPRNCGLFFHMFSWQSPCGNSAGQRRPHSPLLSCRLWDEWAGVSCLHARRAPVGTAVMAQGTSSPHPAGKNPPGRCCPWQELHIQTKMQQEAGLTPAPEVLLGQGLKFAAAIRETATYSILLSSFSQEIKKITRCLFPVIHLLKRLCQFSGKRNKITRARIAQWGKNCTQGKWSWKREWNPVTALSFLQSFVLSHFKEYEREMPAVGKGM